MPRTVLSALHVCTLSPHGDCEVGHDTHFPEEEILAEILGDLPKATWLVIGGARNFTQAI